MAKLYFKYGAMGSSKSAQALITKFNYEELGMSVWLIKPSIDTRDGADAVRSRIGLMAHARIITPEDNIVTEYEKLGKRDVIIADEAQFFTPEQIDQLRQLVDDEDIPVLCFGLRTDFLTHFFPGAQRLMELADSLTEIKTVCACGRKATVNARIDENGRIITEGSQVFLGGNDSYIAMCHKCWKAKIRQQQASCRPLVSADGEDFAGITVNAHSSIRLEGEKIIYIDPFNLEDEPHDADIILFTHKHFDHFSSGDYPKVAKADTVYAAPLSMLPDMLTTRIPEDHIVTLTPGESTEICGVPVETVASYNTNKPMHREEYSWLGYVVTVGGKRIYVAGDCDDIPEGRAVKCDIAMVPIGGTYTMDAKEAAAFVNAISPAGVIPIHYGSIVGELSDAEVFASHLDPGIKLCVKIK